MDKAVWHLFGLALVVAAFVGCATKYRTTVTIEDLSGSHVEAARETGSRANVSGGINPPVCQDPELPHYPPHLAQDGLPPVLVRVEFLIDSEGWIREVVGSVQTDAEQGHAFVNASEEVVKRWRRCQAAWRAGGDPPRWIPLPYRTRVVFRFDAEEIGKKAKLLHAPQS